MSGTLGTFGAAAESLGQAFTGYGLPAVPAGRLVVVIESGLVAADAGRGDVATANVNANPTTSSPEPSRQADRECR
jgi:hypothetical protein